MELITKELSSLKGWELLNAFKTDIENIFRYQPFLLTDREEYRINEHITIRDLKLKTISLNQEGISEEAFQYAKKLLDSFKEKTIDKTLKALHFKFEGEDCLVLCLMEQTAVVSTRLYKKEELINFAKS